MPMGRQARIPGAGPRSWGAPKRKTTPVRPVGQPNVGPGSVLDTESDAAPPARALARMKTTRYFEEQVLRKRPYIRRDWCERVMAHPIRREFKPTAAFDSGASCRCWVTGRSAW